jgi:hypothetical protein
MDRAHVAKLIGRLGEASDRPAALAALDKADVSWGELAELIEHGEAPGGARDKLLRRLVQERLGAALARAAWAMEAGQAKFLRRVLEESGTVEQLVQAVAAADKALRIA